MLCNSSTNLGRFFAIQFHVSHHKRKFGLNPSFKELIARQHLLVEENLKPTLNNEISHQVYRHLYRYTPSRHLNYCQ